MRIRRADQGRDQARPAAARVASISPSRSSAAASRPRHGRQAPLRCWTRISHQPCRPHPHTINHITSSGSCAANCADLFHDTELLGIGTVDPQFRRGVLRRQGIHEFGDGLAALDHLRDNARGIDGVIKAKIAVTDKIWPDISPASGAPALSSASSYGCGGLPDLRRSPRLFNQPARIPSFTSRRMGAPAWRVATSRARKAVSRSPGTCRPLASTRRYGRHRHQIRYQDRPVPPPLRGAEYPGSPDRPDWGDGLEGAVDLRKQNLVRRQADDKRLGHRSAGAAIPDHRQPGRLAPAAGCRHKLAGCHGCPAAPPAMGHAADSQVSGCPRRRRTARPTILKPLWVGGLWLPVTWMKAPHSQLMRGEIQHGGPQPISSPPPPATRPSISALARAGDDSLPSRPTQFPPEARSRWRDE